MLRSTKILPKLVLLLVSVLAVGSLRVGSAHAVTGADWNAGNIIDDSVFYDNNSMSVGDIQGFLNSKVPVCDTNGTQTSEWGGGTRAQYGTSRGYPPPYTCLKDYSQNGMSAAQIIKSAADTYQISPKTLIVLLQKEQTLVTDDWPWSSQYRSATGYGCPDTAACDSQYYGFYNQVMNAARQYRLYYNSPNSYRYKPYQSNYIQYNPNSGCGGTNVNIANMATAGLYNYTPYQPNASALNNLYGSGDSCGAYGNRNFWRLFNDWFGSVRGNAYSWQLVGQAAYTDQNKTTGKGTTNMLPGDLVYVSFVARNTGTTTWSNSSNPVKVGAVSPLDRSSGFCYNWANGCNRPAMLKESSVAPGQNGTFEFWMRAPSTPGAYNERFNLVIDGVAWMPDQGLNFYMTVSQPVYSWQFTGQAAYTDQTKTSGRGTTGMLPGDRVYVAFTAKNTGNVTWYNNGANPVSVGMTQPIDRNSPFYDGSWLGTNRPTRMKESSVAPGQTGSFEFWMTAPSNPGTYVENYSLVAENKAWMNDPGMNFYMTVSPATYSWQFIGQAAFSDQTKATGKGTLGMTRGDRVYVTFTAKNTGNVTWYNNGSNPMSVGMTRPIDRNSPFYDGSWLGQNRPARMKESSVAPGKLANFEFWMKVPNTPGTYREYYSLVAENRAWLNDPGMNFYITVN